MTENTKTDVAAPLYLGVSLSGLFLLPALIYNLPTSWNSFALQTQLTGLIFVSICLLGTTAGLYPSRCLRVTHFKKNAATGDKENEQETSAEKEVTFKGHHPTCRNFSSHVLYFDKKAYCAGCTGLATGAILSIAGSILYFFAGLRLGEISIAIFWLGFLGSACGLLQYKFPTGSRYAHFLLNVIFVFGAFLLLVGIDAMKGNLMVNAYLLTLIVYWIAARIVMSQSEHRKICRNCKVESCSLSFSN